MKKEMKEKLLQILNANPKWPIIIEGVEIANIPYDVVIPASIPSRNLGIIPTEKGLVCPTWVKEITRLSQKQNPIILCIDGLDSILIQDQEKFYGLLKYKAINGYKFPQKTQIVITATNVANISEKILGLCFLAKWE